MTELSPSTQPVRPLRIAAIVPAGDDPPSLDRCLAALRAGRRQPDELVAERRPAGPAALRNAGAAGSEAELLVFVDSDVEVAPDALARIEARFAADPGLAAVFGAYDDDPEAPQLTSRFRNLLHHHVHVRSPGEAETFWAGLGAIRRAEFEAAGGFDAERYPAPSVEDIELGMRLRERGVRIELDPSIRGRHLKAWTPGSMLRTDFGRRGVPWALLLIERRRAGAALNLGWRHRASALAALALLLAGLARRPRAALAALLALLAMNRDLYLLLARRGGPRLALAGVGLHVAHLLAAAASVPAAVLLAASGRERR